MEKPYNIDPRIVLLKALINWGCAAFDLDQLLQLIIETCTSLTSAKASSLLLVDETTQNLYFRIATGDKREEVKKFEIKSGQGIAGHVAKEGRSLLISDVRKDKRWNQIISESIGFETKSIACVPMKTDGKVIGVIEIIDREDGAPLHEEDLEVLSLFAELASYAIKNALEFHHIKRENVHLKNALENKYEIVGNSPVLKRAVQDACKVAHSKASTLILGESGTGKELLARLIHRTGSRKHKPMVFINCGALPETLLEAELFGYEKGAFTGAMAKKIGMIETAHSGTLFLDEVGEMSAAMQVKLLRAVQDGIFYRVGGNVEISSDIRIISATNRDLAQAVSEGRFREDLYYRLNVVQITMPSLRERKEDIPLLAGHFVDIYKQEIGVKTLEISQEAMARMVQYDWPGNVRELENAIERALVMGNGKEILPDDLPIEAPCSMFSRNMRAGMTLKEAVDQFKKEFIIMALADKNGNNSNTAKALDVQRTYLSRLISRYNL
ncbi:MAG: sigma-54-dependent Fis family transcriptional regulator [Pseudomonadota bacterium]